MSTPSVTSVSVTIPQLEPLRKELQREKKFLEKEDSSWMKLANDIARVVYPIIACLIPCFSIPYKNSTSALLIGSCTLLSKSASPFQTKKNPSESYTDRFNSSTLLTKLNNLLACRFEINEQKRIREHFLFQLENLQDRIRLNPVLESAKWLEEDLKKLIQDLKPILDGETFDSKKAENAHTKLDENKGLIDRAAKHASSFECLKRDLANIRTSHKVSMVFVAAMNGIIAATSGFLLYQRAFTLSLNVTLVFLMIMGVKEAVGKISQFRAYPYAKKAVEELSILSERVPRNSDEITTKEQAVAIFRLFNEREQFFAKLEKKSKIQPLFTIAIDVVRRWPAQEYIKNVKALVELFNKRQFNIARGLRRDVA